MILTPPVRLTLGLIMMAISVLLIADIFGLTKDETKGIIQARIQFSESLALQISKDAAQGSYGEIERKIKTLVKRKKEILSVGVRSGNGVLLYSTSEHKKLWTQKHDEKFSTSSQIKLSIFKGRQLWGNLEVRFKPISVFTIFGFPVERIVLLIGFIATAMFILFLTFLRRSLKHLDPSSVIPDRVRSALDVLAEGVVIIDKNDNIVLANIAFSKKIEMDPSKLTGKKIYNLPWVIGDEKKNKFDYPWKHAASTKESIKGTQISIYLPDGSICNFEINCAPIFDENNNARGVLSTFDDVTKLEKRNSQLQEMLSMLTESQKEVEKKNQELEILATVDPLTSVLNRRAFFDLLDKSFKRAKREKNLITCMMLDIDHFKNVNDTYGHQVGDDVIKTLAATLKDTVRENDYVARYGGEEFCILVNSPIEVGLGLAERIRVLITDLEFHDASKNRTIKVSSSFGVAQIDDTINTPEELIERADKALYHAKETGRNKVVQWSKEILVNTQDEPHKERALNTNEDAVTALPFRSVFIDNVKSLITEAESSKENFALVFLDINMFKRINNTFGHDFGDKVLKEASLRILKSVRKHHGVSRFRKSSVDNANLSRIDGDEFGFVIYPILSIDKLEATISRVINDISAPFNLSGSEFHLSCSIGISLFPNDGHTAEMLFKHAELAMYEAKSLGKNKFQYYAKNLDTTTAELLQLEYDLQHALDNQQFKLYYQSKIDSKTLKITGFEALIRWDHPNIGIVSPAQFIPLAEEIGQINAIGYWVIHQACLDIRRWLDMGYSDIHVSVNMSILQFKQADLFEKIVSILKKTKVNPSHLEIEITESTLMENMQSVVQTLEKLHAIGLRITIDDFGIGYSSFSYVKRFPVDTLKIDRSFIQNISTDKDDIEIVTAVIAMAQTMKLRVVAEGVENLEQVYILQKLGCDEMQGFYFSKPIEYERATVLLSHVIDKHTARKKGPKLDDSEQAM